uniref:MYND-type domain-containing protein n=1 Tax=Chaetoceros debilis TaxID=122233 RepID=A0A6S8TMT2_9STRA|mmetsp:Transcript_20034/g.30332  ORF Transcript_20034/g.30332 Transcript_20034/m.30332 type:complete len:305 (+) Transcript_20034:132-1046(+)
MVAFEKGTLCTITGLKNRTDLNGLKCTVKTTKSKKGNHERIPVTVFHDGSEINILLKRENLCPYMNTPDILQGLSGLNLDETQLLLATNTVNDVNEIHLKYDSLIERLEEAISHRNHGRFVDAEIILEKVLSAVEDLCGKKSVKVATFLKSFGLLRLQQRRWNEAEDFLLRADELRPADCEENSQGTQTLEYIFSAQVKGRVFKKASDTLTRLKDLKHCVRPGIDTDSSELETELEAAKKSHAQCVVCRRWSILSACARCHLTVYCSRSCQKSHWKIHKRVCQTTSRVSLNENSKLQSSKTPFD